VTDTADPLAAAPIVFDPASAPHDPAFAAPHARGTAVAAAELDPLAIKKRFAFPPAWQPELRRDLTLFPDRPARIASVLIALRVRDDQVSVLLTQRTAHLHDHGGQISFPGGRVEAADAGAIDTALREANEEIGLPPDHVQVLGTLPEYETATRYRVTCVIGMVERAFVPVLDAFEVSELFEVPLAFLMNPAHHERRMIRIGEATRSFYAMPYVAAGFNVPEASAAPVAPRFIWGATAAMLRNLYHFMRA